ncbi:MAG: hypothetical protein HW385_1224 [candidate division NC10 bacterium]|nr:hypothetical protein [candidate division NC10 bacterium]
MTARICNTRLDISRQSLVCQVCGDEIPFPLGDVAWVQAITRAFANAHRGHRHQGGRTAFTCIREAGEHWRPVVGQEGVTEGTHPDPPTIEDMVGILKHEAPGGDCSAEVTGA